MKYYIGILLIFVTVIFSISPYGLILNIPIYFIAILLLWTSDKKTKVKIIWSSFPILWIPILMLSTAYSNTLIDYFGQKIEFRFEEGFSGKVIIVSPIKCGQPVIFEGDKELIIIPKSGLVYYQGTIESNSNNWTYKTKENNEYIFLYKNEGSRLNEKSLNQFRIFPDSLIITSFSNYQLGIMDSIQCSNYSVNGFWVNKWSQRKNTYENENESELIADKIIMRLKKCKTQK